LVVFLSVIQLASTAKFRLDRFCAFNCNRGRGGLLCKCNAFHFAGKRTLGSEYSDKGQKDYLYDDLYDDKMNVDRRENVNNVDIPSFDDQLAMAGNLQTADDNKMESTRLFIRWLLQRLDKERYVFLSI